MSQLFNLLATAFVASSPFSAVLAQAETEWITVNLSTPGNLGVEILYQADRLSDVTRLRVSGPLNDADWTTISNLSQIQEIDLSNAITSAIPASAFEGRTSLISIKLPANLTSIKENAFSGTSLTEIYFPASLTSIEYYGFYRSALKRVEFEEGSALNYLGQYVFYNCSQLESVRFDTRSPLLEIPYYAFNSCESLTEVILPEAVESIMSNAFYRTSALRNITFPSRLLFIGSYAFYNSGLVSLALPAHLNTIEDYAFSNCSDLKELELPTSIHRLSDQQFHNCKQLKRVVCKAPTPPSASKNSSPFNHDLSDATLVVPDFALPDYKLDTYWMTFGTIEGGAVSDYWDIDWHVSLLNDRRFDGTPAVNLRTNAAFSVGGNAPCPLDVLTLNYDWSSSNNWFISQMINSSPLMSANKVQVRYSLPYNSWRFLSLPFDVRRRDIIHEDSEASIAVRYYDGAVRAELNNTGSSWKDIGEDEIIKAGTGFIIQTNKSGTVTFPCADEGLQSIFNPNAISIPLKANVAESAAHSGWNYVANPYPSRYDMYYAALTSPITIYDTNQRNYVAYSLIDDDVVLGPNMPFFIQASEELSEIIFGTTGRQFDSEIAREKSQARAALRSARSLFDLSLTVGDLKDNSRIILNEKASEEYEVVRDAAKFFSDDLSVPQLFSLNAAGDRLAINERDTRDGNVRLGFFAPAAGEMVLTMNRADGEAILIDAETGTRTAMSAGDKYSFTVSTPGQNESRFSLILKSQGELSVEAPSRFTEIVVNNVSGGVVINGAEGQQVTVLSLDGAIVSERESISDNQFLPLAKGLYIVKVGETSAKIFVK
ncbi:MAG: leucine-rich repeat domain-containing protein [Bacteroides sp.]|nr:leucine-rich repeat domain-containing protein [Bacteroides sp.]